MFDIRNKVAKYNTYSAKKQMAINNLTAAGMVKTDDEFFVYNSEVGDRVLDALVDVFNLNISNYILK